MKKQNRKQGFTLVELLVVIAILAILATVSIVGYTAFIKKAHQSNANAEAHQILNAIRAELISGESLVIGKVESAEGVSPATSTSYSISHNGQNAVLTVETSTPAADGATEPTITTETYTIKLEGGAYKFYKDTATESSALPTLPTEFDLTAVNALIDGLDGTINLTIDEANGLSALYTYTSNGVEPINVRINFNDLETIEIVPATAA